MEQHTVTYSIIPEPSHDGSWWAIAPDLPGLLMYGNTRDQLIANAPHAIADFLDELRESGFPIDPPGTHPFELIYDQEEPVPIPVTVPAA